MMLLFGLLSWALISVAHRLEEPTSQDPLADRQTPLEILEERYASGELLDEEFDRMRQRLGSRADDS